ncbi:GPI ethanolamine phosphate transferase 3 [Pyrenophora tritici-repentis]|nr:GPI ethanolamine phosphate transferase 3 [Pyrenophora tritici-repentis]
MEWYAPKEVQENFVFPDSERIRGKSSREGECKSKTGPAPNAVRDRRHETKLERPESGRATNDATECGRDDENVGPGIFWHKYGETDTKDASKNEAYSASREEDGCNITAITIDDSSVHGKNEQTGSQDRDATDHSWNVKSSPEIATDAERVALVSPKGLVDLTHFFAVSFGLAKRVPYVVCTCPECE